jgi:uncharacterized protein (TIGR01244 family)
MSKLKLFFISFLLTTGGLLTFIYLQRPQPSLTSFPKLVPIATDLFLTSQLKPENIPSLRDRGIKTVVDMRPDGEAWNQAPSSTIEAISKGNGLNFYYIPVPHESIPLGAVDALAEALSHEAKPAFLYCRTGRRAVRLFALVEASRVDGPSADAIIGMVRAAGFSADDLKDDIAQRLAHRNNPPVVNP